MTMYFSDLSAVIEFFEERAAILEYDGGLSRSEAEEQAAKEAAGKRKWLADEIQKHRQKISGKVCG